MTDQTQDRPAERAARRAPWDVARVVGTNGALGGTNGAYLRAWLAIVAVLALAVFVNVMTALDDAHRYAVALPLALPLTLEGTSATALLIAAIVVAVALRIAPPLSKPLWRTLAIHAGASIVFSVVHVGLMVLFRLVAFAAEHRAFSWSPAELPYEYRKDLLTYLVLGSVIWALTRDRSPRMESAATISDTIDIRDGANLLRVPVREIVAARAAGNYVEFSLHDGRQPLMRASMAQVETMLAPHGFVRTHRSWLVNAARLRAVTAAGSGDFRVDLDGGVTAPLSRRYPAALARLKGGG